MVISFLSECFVGNVIFFVNGPGDMGRVIPKIFKMVFDNPLFSTQQYKVRIMGKVKQSSKRSNALLYISV